MQLDLSLTIESGQTPTFTFENAGGRYRRAGGGMELWTEGGLLKASRGHAGAARILMREGNDVKAVVERITQGDATMTRAAQSFPGLRLTKSDSWETTVAFLASQNNNIPRITKIVRGLMREGRVMTPAEILCADITGLKMGYREAFLKETARLIAENGFSLDKIEGMKTHDARGELMQLPGVGPKVADCIMLYGMAKDDAFPADAWVKRAMEEWYGAKGERQVEKFKEEAWGDDAGYAQQLLFLLARKEL